MHKMTVWELMHNTVQARNENLSRCLLKTLPLGCEPKVFEALKLFFPSPPYRLDNAIYTVDAVIVSDMLGANLTRNRKEKFNEIEED